MKQVPIHLPVFFPSSSTVFLLFSSIGEHVTLNQNKRQNNRGSHICLPYSVSKYLTRPQKKLSERHKGNNKHEKNNRIFEKEKNILVNRDGHFYDGYPGKNTFRKAVVLQISIHWGSRDHRSSETMPSSPSLKTEPGEHLLLLMGLESWSEVTGTGIQLLLTDGPNHKIPEGRLTPWSFGERTKTLV